MYYRVNGSNYKSKPRREQLASAIQLIGALLGFLVIVAGLICQ